MRLYDKKSTLLLFSGGVIAFIVFAVFVFQLSYGDGEVKNPMLVEEEKGSSQVPIYDEFGIPMGAYDVAQGVVRSGQTLALLLSGLGLSGAEIHEVTQSMEGLFDPRRVRRGHNFYSYHLTEDRNEPLRYFVYEISDLDFLKVQFFDSLSVVRELKDVQTISRSASGIIDVSLWNTIIDQDLPHELVAQLSRILAWTVDFYRIERGDRFKVLYREDYVGDRAVGISGIDAVYFRHRGRDIEGYHFESDTIYGYFDAHGNSLQKVFLRAPLEYVRISSGFSYSRRHPIHGDRRPHLGTDYAAPHGTPILAVGDGVVTRASYSSGNGNYVRIRHNAVYETQYLHMSRFASGIRSGAEVRQGDVIGYVGSTGSATGPHVCFRFWKNGQQVNHLNLEFPSGDSLPEAYMDQFICLRDQRKYALNLIRFGDEELPLLPISIMLR